MLAEPSVPIAAPPLHTAAPSARQAQMWGSYVDNFFRKGIFVSDNPEVAGEGVAFAKLRALFGYLARRWRYLERIVEHPARDLEIRSRWYWLTYQNGNLDWDDSDYYTIDYDSFGEFYYGMQPLQIALSSKSNLVDPLWAVVFTEDEYNRYCDLDNIDNYARNYLCRGMYHTSAPKRVGGFAILFAWPKSRAAGGLV